MEKVMRQTSSVIMLACLVLWGASPASWAGSPQPQLVDKKAAAQSKAPHAILKTKFGEMEIVLFQDIAPKHVESFMTLAKKNFYNGTIFHRVIPGFMIQGGDPNTKDPSPSKFKDYGKGGPGYTLPLEKSNIPHERGIVSAARTADPNSAGSQFFIMVDRARHLDGQYTVFGEVIKGMEVADMIVKQPRDPRDSPLERLEMTIEIVE